MKHLSVLTALMVFAAATVLPSAGAQSTSLLGQAISREVLRESSSKSAVVVDTASLFAASVALGQPPIGAKAVAELFPGRSVVLVPGLDTDAEARLRQLSSIFVSIQVSQQKAESSDANDSGTSSFQVRVAVGLDEDRLSKGSLGYFAIQTRDGTAQLIYYGSKQY